MEKFILGIGSFFLFWAVGAQQITFTYDNSGNQIRRELCINCSSRSAQEIKSFDSLVDADLEKFSPNDVLSYYPNPVKETLFLSWSIQENRSVAKISIFSNSGQQLYATSNVKDRQKAELAFASYPQGLYHVVVEYNDQSQESIKIVKQ